MSEHQQNPQIEGLGPVRQLGHVVEDIPNSIKQWEGQGVGPWLWMRNVRLNSVYRGVPSRPLIDVALSYRGDVQIELIQPRDDAPSPYRETALSGQWGLHHHAWLCRDIHQTVDRLQGGGLEMVCDIHMMGSRYVYMQTTSGEYVELLPASPMMRAMFARGIAVSRRWKGKGDPVILDIRNPVTLMGSLPGSMLAWLSRW